MTAKTLTTAQANAVRTALMPAASDGVREGSPLFERFVIDARANTLAVLIRLGLAETITEVVGIDREEIASHVLTFLGEWVRSYMRAEGVDTVSLSQLAAVATDPEHHRARQEWEQERAPKQEETAPAAPAYRTSDGVEIVAGLRVETNNRRPGTVASHQFTRGGITDPGGKYFNGWFEVDEDGRGVSLFNGERMRSITPAPDLSASVETVRAHRASVAAAIAAHKKGSSDWATVPIGTFVSFLTGTAKKKDGPDVLTCRTGEVVDTASRSVANGRLRFVDYKIREDGTGELHVITSGRVRVLNRQPYPTDTDTIRFVAASKLEPGDAVMNGYDADMIVKATRPVTVTESHGFPCDPEEVTEVTYTVDGREYRDTWTDDHAMPVRKVAANLRRTGCTWPSGIHAYADGTCTRCGAEEATPAPKVDDMRDVIARLRKH